MQDLHCCLPLNDLLHLVRQRLHLWVSDQTIVPRFAIQRSTFSPNPSQGCKRRIWCSRFPSLFLQLLEVVQGRVGYGPLVTSLLLELGDDLVRRRSEGVDNENLVLRLPRMLKTCNDKLANTVVFISSTQSVKQNSRLTYSCIVVKATFPFPSPNNTAFLALTSKVLISLLLDFHIYISLYGPVTR